MEEKITLIVNEMSECLNVSQLKKLQEILLKYFAQDVPKKIKISNMEYLELFLDAKR